MSSNVVHAAAQQTIDNEQNLLELKAANLVFVDGLRLKKALYDVGLMHYTSRGPHRKGYERVRRLIKARKQEQLKKSNAKKSK